MTLYALFTTSIIGPVEDEHEAQEVADKIQQSAELNYLSVLEQHDVTEDDAHELGIRNLGTFFSVFDGFEEYA